MSLTRALCRTSLRAPSLLLAVRTTPFVRSYADVTVISTQTNSGAPMLANIEASWEELPPEEQGQVYKRLQDLQRRDWKELSMEEKKAAYYVSFGPHGPRKPHNPPGFVWKTIAGVSGIVAASLGAFAIIRMFAPEPPQTMTREWQEASNEYMRSQNMNPITGVSSEGYKGKGMIQ